MSIEETAAGRQHSAQSTAQGHAHWPADIRPISTDGLDYLGVGNDGRLYWDGKPIEVSKSFALTWFQRAIAIVVSGSAVVAAIAAAVQAYAAWQGIR